MAHIEIELGEQIGLIDRIISENRRMMHLFSDDDLFDVKEVRRDLKVLHAIRESLQFEHLLEKEVPKIAMQEKAECEL